MAYNESIDTRIKAVAEEWDNTEAKRLFGGVCHLIHGNMFCGVHKDYLILRVGEKLNDSLISQEHIRPFDMTGRPMKGWVTVDEAGFTSDTRLRELLELARNFALTLPPKAQKR